MAHGVNHEPFISKPQVSVETLINAELPAVKVFP